MQASKNFLRRVGAFCDAVIYHPLTLTLIHSAGTAAGVYGAYQSASHHQYAWAAMSALWAYVWGQNLPRDLHRLGDWAGSQRSRFSAHSLA